jgi:hypothetical protein
VQRVAASSIRQSVSGALQRNDGSPCRVKPCFRSQHQVARRIQLRVNNRADAGPLNACKTRLLDRLSAVIACGGSEVASDASTRSSNHSQNPSIHNLADRSSLAPASSRERLPLVIALLACLIRWLHTGRASTQKAANDCSPAGHPAGDDSHSTHCGCARPRPRRIASIAACLYRPCS